MFVQDCLQLGIAAQKMWDKGLFVFDYCLSVINNFLSLNIIASLNRKQKHAQQNNIKNVHNKIARRFERFCFLHIV